MICKRNIFSGLIALMTIMIFSLIGCESEFNTDFQQTEVPAGTGRWIIQLENNLDTTGDLGNITSSGAIAQSFQADADCNVSGFWIKISRTGTFSYNEVTGVGDKIVGYLCDDNAGEPKATFHARTEKIIISNMSTEADFIPFIFNSALRPPITGVTKYWIKIEIEWDGVPDAGPNDADDNREDAGSYLTFYYSASDEYAGHKLMHRTGGAWVDDEYNAGAWNDIGGGGTEDLGLKIWGVF